MYSLFLRREEAEDEATQLIVCRLSALVRHNLRHINIAEILVIDAEMIFTAPIVKIPHRKRI